MRLFIGYALTPTSKQTLSMLQKSLPEALNAQLMIEKNFHLTLVYLGEITQEQFVRLQREYAKVKLAQIEHITLNGVTTFTKRRSQIIVADIGLTDGLQANWQSIKQGAINVGIPLEPADVFRPHITLMRQKDEKIEKNFQKKWELSVEGLMFFKSYRDFTGINYTPIAKI